MTKIALSSLVLTLAAAAALHAAQEVPSTGKNLGSVTGGDFQKKALHVIEKRCTACHSSAMIAKALTAGKDMAAIQGEMEKKGAKLSRNDKEVLGIYWKQHPLKEQK